MKSNIILIDNRGNGFDKALAETGKVAAYEELNHKQTIQLQLCTEEMLSLARSITGEMQASFWIEAEECKFDLHMTTETAMDSEKRAMLLASSSTGKNEAARSFLGHIRDAFERAMALEVSHNNDLPEEVELDDVVNRVIECTDPEWDGYEQSTLKRLADTIRIAIRGDKVEIIVSKKFA